ncbi:uncharacterized protein LOC130190425 [Pseudoliparis swirei]|uniref:uncharacterized protein LOC130190425 n=1 Tax=Pseudoliparis swirei TaxID=2059687 RepID=UPI0024BE8FFB|nr:uncharacterized protein LOC130190425 [Pseudoliparis swirei]
MVLACFCKDIQQTHRSHTHCPFCNYRVFARIWSFRKHLLQIHGIESSKKRETTQKDNAATEKSGEITQETVSPKEKPFPCVYCPVFFTTSANLRRHIRDAHNRPTTPILCIDPNHGIYVTPKHESGPLLPIHVVKCISTPAIECEVALCRKLMELANASGYPGKECIHLERIKYADLYVPPASVQHISLQEMLDKALISTEWSECCKELQSATKTSEVSTPFYMERLDFRKDGCSSQSSPAKGTIGAALSGPLSALTLWGVSGIVRVEEVDSLTAVSTT